MKNSVLFVRMDENMKDKIKTMKKKLKYSDIQQLLEFLIDRYEKTELNPNQLTILDKIHIRQNELEQKLNLLSNKIEKLTEILGNSIIAYKGIKALDFLND